MTATTKGRRRRSKKSTAGKQESRRRVSASTTAPRAPCASSSHMNQKRFWPGVPNRYRISSGLIVIRPKSRATVVVVLLSTPASLSTPDDASVISSSVRRGGTSLTEPTSVVLPTPKPPATTIFTAELSRRSEPSDAIENRLQYLLTRCFGRHVRGPEDHQTLRDQVAQHDLHHLQRQVERGRHLGDRDRLLADLQRLGVLGLQVDLRPRAHRHDQGDQVQPECAG